MAIRPSCQTHGLCNCASLKKEISKNSSQFKQILESEGILNI